MKKKITHISTVHPAFDTRIFYKECCSLADEGYEVNLIVTHTKNEIVNGVNIIALSEIKNRVIRIIFKPWLAMIKALKTNSSVFHFHDPELIPVGIFLRLLGKKVVYDVHEDVSAQIINKHWIPSWARFTISKVFSVIESMSSRFFTGIVAATPFIGNKFKRINKNTINVNNYPLLSESSTYEFSEKEPYSICYIGGITKERGIIDLINAIENTKIKLYLAGSFSDSSLEKEVKSLNGWKNVDYVGFLNRAQLKEILKKSMIGACLFHKIENHKHSLPNKIFEYWNSGVFVLASDIDYWKCLFKNSQSIGFVDPTSHDIIREKLENLFSNINYLYENGKKAKSDILETYNWDFEFNKMLDFYKKSKI